MYIFLKKRNSNSREFSCVFFSLILFISFLNEKILEKSTVVVICVKLAIFIEKDKINKYNINKTTIITLFVKMKKQNKLQYQIAANWFIYINCIFKVFFFELYYKYYWNKNREKQLKLFENSKRSFCFLYLEYIFKKMNILMWCSHLNNVKDRELLPNHRHSVIKASGNASTPVNNRKTRR